MLQINHLPWSWYNKHFSHSPQICYVEVFDIMNPRFNKQIWAVPCDVVKSRFHCNSVSKTLIRYMYLKWWKPMLGFPKCIQDHFYCYLYINLKLSLFIFTCSSWSIWNVFISRKVIECRNKSHAHVLNTPAVFFISVFWVVMDKTLTAVHRLPLPMDYPNWLP